jgi:hypothetical protein
MSLKVILVIHNSWLLSKLLDFALFSRLVLVISYCLPGLSPAHSVRLLRVIRHGVGKGLACYYAWWLSPRFLVNLSSLAFLCHIIFRMLNRINEINVTYLTAVFNS